MHKEERNGGRAFITASSGIDGAWSWHNIAYLLTSPTICEVGSGHLRR